MEELTISAMMPPRNSELKPTLVLGRGGFNLTLSSVDLAKLKEAIISLEEDAAVASEPDSLVDDISAKPEEEDVESTF
jgi:hypothetical protein